MLEKIIDLHIHSKYSRACSGQLELPKIATACVQKGVDICATGDYTHPGWFAHIKEALEEVEKSGLYKLKNATGKEANIRFILSTEVSCIYKHKDKTRRLHHVILAPNISAVEKLIQELEKRHINIHSDGRPIMGLKSKELLQILLDIDLRFFLIPAHAWTPWFAIFGSKSGYDSIEECFEELAPHIRAIETGLSSDPTMNHRLSALDNITLVSNSDAHSLDKIGREANVFGFEKETDISYDEIIKIIKTGDRKRFLYTIEFYPEEGKYHADGHLSCEVCLLPNETKKLHKICPRCKKELTIGVLSRIDDLADRTEKEIKPEKFIPHKYIVPLREVIASIFEVGPSSKKVAREYDNLIKNLGSEFFILLKADINKIEQVANDKNIALAITNMRAGKVQVSPGYDGKFGLVKVIFDKKFKPAQSRLI